MIKSVPETVIDLRGPDGNAFALLSYAKRFSNELGLNTNDILDEMTSSDYENLVNVFENYFGSFVTLYK